MISSMKNWRKKTDKLLDKYKLEMSIVHKEQKSWVAAEDELTYVLEAQIIIQSIAQEVQQEAHKSLAGIVSKCLKSVFEDAYEFCMDFDRKRGKTVARLYFKRRGNEIDPMQGSGGGVVDVASFALRLACLLLTQPSLRRTIILDEPFKFVSEYKQYRQRVCDLVLELSRELQVQIIMVTNISDLELGKVIRL